MSGKPNLLKKLIITDKKFNENWDPSNSTRERQKLTKVYNKKRDLADSVYDDKGIHIKTGLDVCDCFDRECPGCYFPCPKCESSKCGCVCRVNRKYVYESQMAEGEDISEKNPLS